jgi:undecaprenyl-phosphate galactose phosphotransferase/putative colanic acid biosynthesis UDP-glucose lipid carrier transferase
MSVESELGELKVVSEKSAGRSRLVLPCEAIPYLLSTADAIIILSVSLVCVFLYHWGIGSSIPDLAAYFALGLIASFIFVVQLSGRGYYDFETAAKPDTEIIEILFAWLTTGLMLAFFAFLFKIGVSFSRGSFLLFLAIAPIGLLGGRKAAKVLLKRAVDHGAIGRRNTVLIGGRAELASLRQRDMLTFFGAGDVNRFELPEAEDPLQQDASDVIVLEAAASFVRRHSSAEILLAVSWNDVARIDLIREQIKLLPVSAKLLPDARVRTLTNYASSAGQRVLSIEIQRAPFSLTERIVKRAMDILLSLIAILVLLPMMMIAAAAIKLEGTGPVIFRQSRKGFNERKFVMFKFRTMTVQENGDVVTQAARHDPRVTRIGRVLRSTSIDELPQLVNVLRGEMSLIGPRPHAVAHDNQFEKVLEDYAFRRHVKPGMTGWAQVNGLRGATPSIETIARRVEMDLWYINNWSLWLDLQILVKTAFEVLRKRNAY